MRAYGIGLAVLLLSLATIQPSSASGPDDGWSSAFAPPGVSREVFAFAELDGALIAGDERWTGSGWERLGDGLNGHVYALTMFEGALVAGGYLRPSGVVAGVARWNGTSWEPLGAVGGRALAVYDGQLYTAGYNSIFRWDDASWTNVMQVGGPYMEEGIKALGVYNGLLVAGGDFTTAGGVAVPGLIGWNGESAVSLGAPYGAGWFSAAASSVTYGLAVYNGRLCAAGTYYAAGQYTAAIVSWDGVNWTSFYVNGNQLLRCFALCGDRLYAAGSSHLGFIEAPSRGVTLIWWDGTSWHDPGDQGYGNINVLLPCSAGLAVGGSFDYLDWSIVSPNAALWNGSAFLPLVGGGQGVGGDVNLLAVDDGHLVVAGEFFVAGNTMAPSYARWHGTAWSSCYPSLYTPYPLAFSSPTSLCTAGGTTLLTGFYFWAPQEFCLSLNECELAGSWNTVFWAMACQAGKFYGCGNDYSNGTYGSEVDRLDGSIWTRIGQTGTGSIDCAASTSSGLAVGGEFGVIGGTPAQGVSRWDGAAWQPFGSGLAGKVTALAEHAGAVHAGGSIAAAGGSPLQRVMRWDGATWQALGDTFDGPINCLASCSGDLYAAGAFTHAGSTPAARIAKWDGAAWQALGSGLDDEVLALQPLQDALYVGGRFHNAGGKPSFHLAAWPTSVVGVELRDFVASRSDAGAVVSWTMTGASSQEGYRLLRGGPTESVVATGTWNTTGSEQYDVADPQAPATACDYWLEYVVAYDNVRRYGPAHLAAATVPSAMHLYPAAPNPFNPRTTIRFDLPGAGQARLSIYDVAGRLVKVLVDGEFPAGSHEAVWEGRDAGGRGMASGSYFARLETTSGREITRMMLIR